MDRTRTNKESPCCLPEQRMDFNNFPSARPLSRRLSRLNVVAEQAIFVTHVQPAIRDDWMCPGFFLGTIRLLETPVLFVSGRTGLNQRERALILVAQHEPIVSVSN